MIARIMRTLAELQRGAGTPGPGAPGGLALDVRAVRTFDTPEFAGMTFLEVETGSALNRVQGMPFGWSINPYRGCSHACAYCFARPTHAYLNMSPVADFERRVVVKTNLVEVLRRELVRPSWAGEHVALGTNTDPYQRCEGRYGLMPGVIDALAEFLTPFSILTKGTLVTRDIDRLAAAARRVDVSAALTIGMLDDALWRSSEPGTPSPRARLDAVRALNDRGIPTGVMLAPIMPGLNDGHDELAALVDAAAAAGATHITPIVLHLRRSGERGRGGPPRPPGWQSVREVFWPWLTERHPELVGRYEALYRGASASAEYRREIEGFVAARRRSAWRRHGHPRAGSRRSRVQGAAVVARTPPGRGEQLRLW
jgi:DNA repair photolyase